MDIIAKITLQTPDGYVQPGETTKLDDTEAKALMARGFAEPAASSKSPETRTDKADGDILAIMDAIAVLDEAGFGKDGKPLIKALEAVLDRDVSQAARDQAWKRYEADTAS